jgi:hypothetical protein
VAAKLAIANELGLPLIKLAPDGPAGAFVQKYTVLHNVLSDNRLYDKKTASEITDFLAQELF